MRTSVEWKEQGNMKQRHRWIRWDRWRGALTQRRWQRVATGACLLLLLSLLFAGFARFADASAERTWASDDAEFAFVGAPSISLATYRAVYCEPRHGRVSDACAATPQMYDVLVAASIDPAIELAFAARETEFGTTGPGRAPQHNLYGIVCNTWDGGRCEGPYHPRFATYDSYVHATEAWVALMLHRGLYVDAGRTTLREVYPIYAPPHENDTAMFIRSAEAWVRGWRASDAGSAAVSMPPIQGVGLREPAPALDMPHVPPEATLVDNSDYGFSSNQDTWIAGWCGVNGRHVAARSAADVQQSVSRAFWMPPALAAGRYEVRVYVPSCGFAAASRSARYRVVHSGRHTEVKIDQQAHAGQWVSLGTYDVASNDETAMMVQIDDVSGEQGRDVLVDAVVWLPLPPDVAHAPTPEPSSEASEAAPAAQPPAIFMPAQQTDGITAAVPLSPPTPTLSPAPSPVSDLPLLPLDDARTDDTRNPFRAGK